MSRSEDDPLFPFDPACPSPMRLVCEFHRLTDQPVEACPTLPERSVAKSRKEMAAEEFLEYANEVNRGLREVGASPLREAKNIAKIARELADTVYIAYGTALCYGVDLDAVIAEVHTANMAKGKPKVEKRIDGKVLKPPGWYPPDVHGVIFGTA